MRTNIALVLPAWTIKNDYLIPDTESEKKIKAFLEAKLKTEEVQHNIIYTNRDYPAHRFKTIDSLS